MTRPSPTTSPSASPTAAAPTPTTRRPTTAATRTATARPTRGALGRSSALMSLGTLASRITGAGRNIALASFALGGFTDTYTQANNTPNMVYELVAGGVLGATLVPLFSRLDHRRSRRARDGVDAIATLGLVVVVAAAIAVAIAAPWILWIPFHEPKNALKLHVGTKLLRLFAPQIAFYGFGTMATAMLNVRRRFFVPMLAPVLNNVLVIATLVWVHRLLRARHRGVDYLDAIATDSTALLILGIGTTAGVLAMTIALIPSLRRSGRSFRWRWEPRHPAIKQLSRLSGWTLGYVACNLAALQFVLAAAQTNRGDASAYSIAYSTYFLLPHSLFAVSIATAAQPELARAFIEHRRNRFRSVLTRAMRLQLTLMIPAAVGSFILARPIIRSLKFGELNSRDVTLFVDVLRAFVIGLPFFSLYLLLINACKAMLDNRIAFIVNAVENSVNVLLAALFVVLGWGVRGLALAFALAYVAAAALAFGVVHRRLRHLDESMLTRSTLRIGAASAAMGIAAWAATRAVAAIVASDTRLGALLQVGAGLAAGVTVYVGIGRRLGIDDIAAVVDTLSRRLGARRA